jgi:hypothetical protein
MPGSCQYYTDEGFLYHKQELEEGLPDRAEPELFFMQTDMKLIYFSML